MLSHIVIAYYCTCHRNWIDPEVTHNRKVTGFIPETEAGA